jgi:hypothetical protein
MNLPKQSRPVTRGVSHDPLKARVEGSGLACDLCHAACSNIFSPGLPQELCNAACNRSPACP